MNKYWWAFDLIVAVGCLNIDIYTKNEQLCVGIFMLMNAFAWLIVYRDLMRDQ
jgi:hypothetical protein